MKKTILVTTIALMLAAVPAMAQMMGSGQQMMEQQQVQQTAPAGGQNYPQYMNPAMMGGYGYGMGPGMLGGGYGYGMHHGMMGGYGYGMGPQMMGGCGMGMAPGMMGYYSPEQYEKQYKEFQSFLDDTRDLRRKMHTLKFDFAEAQRNSATKPEDLKKMNTEMESIWKQIYEKRKSEFK